MTLPAVVYLQLAGIYDFSQRSQKLDMQNLAQGSGVMMFCKYAIGFEPDGVTYEIACIIEMEINFFLWIQFVELIDFLHITGQGVY